MSRAAVHGIAGEAALRCRPRARAYGSLTCAVPIDGAAVTDDAVRTLTHPDAYPIAFVTGPGAAEQFRGRGMLPVSDPW
jgi:hypothetical protein